MPTTKRATAPTTESLLPITASKPKLPVHRMPLYNPQRMDDADVVSAFVVRKSPFERLMADIGSETPRSRAQHHLIIGQRGMGKTTLLMRLAAELRSEKYRDSFLPLVFAEEQYAIDRLSKFWLNCLDSLADALERIGEVAAAEKIDVTVQQLQLRLTKGIAQEELLAREAFDALTESVRLVEVFPVAPRETQAPLRKVKGKRQAIAGPIHRRPVLLVDNVQLVFERITDEEQHVLREVMQRPGAPILVAASPSAPTATHEYQAAFYDQFKAQYLKPLSAEDMSDLLISLARISGRDDVGAKVRAHSGRVRALHQLTGGNPRTTMMLFHLYAEDFAPSVFGDLSQLLDHATPLYKAIFEELPPQQQVIVVTLADFWDPMPSRELCERTGLAQNQISPQLDRLKRQGFVEEVDLFPGPRRGYQLVERFFNIWLLMRSSSRRQRKQIEFLTRFLESFYEPADRERLAGGLLAERTLNRDRMVFAMSLSETLRDRHSKEELQRHAQLDALHQKAADAQRELDELLDFKSLPPATLAFEDLRSKFGSMVPSRAKISGDDFATEVLGCREFFKSRERDRLAFQKRLTVAQLHQAKKAISASREADIKTYGEPAVAWLSDRLSSGQLRNIDDLEDWNRTFVKCPNDQPSVMQILVDTVPQQIGAQLSKNAFESIQVVLAPSKGATARNWFKWGYALQMVLGRYKLAATAYRNAIAADSNSPRSWNNLGNILRDDQHRYAEAEAAYRHSIDADPKWALPWRNLGILLRFNMKRYTEAEAAYQRAIEIDPNNSYAWQYLGDLLQFELRRYTEAEAAYQRAIKIDPKHADAWHGLVFLYHDSLARFDEALIAGRKVVELVPDMSDAWNNLGYMLCYQPDSFNEAESALRKAIELDPCDFVAWQNLVFLQRDFLGDLASARVTFATLPQPEPPKEQVETIEFQEALFSAYECNWGDARRKLGEGLDCASTGWVLPAAHHKICTTAVLLHLNFGAEFLELLQERGDDQRLRPWYEAIRAVKLGDRRHLLNIAAEVRPTAEWFFDQITKRLDALPGTTRRRPFPTVKKAATRRRRSR